MIESHPLPFTRASRAIARALHWRRSARGGALVLAAVVACRTPAPAVSTPEPVPGPVVRETPPPAWKAAQGRLMTRWAAHVSADRVHPEYPRPQMVRPRWQSLNGVWEFAVVADSTQPVRFGERLPERILVPFAMESALSGLMRHADRVLYRRTFRRPAMQDGERLLLRFDAVDWQAVVWVNGRRMGEHTGGFDAFAFDVTDALRPGDVEQEVVVSVWDPTDKFGQPRGKQVSNPEGIWYTPVTGIWQTVWLEPVPRTHIAGMRMTPDVGAEVLRIRVDAAGGQGTPRVTVSASTGDRVVGRVEGAAAEELRLPVPQPRLWSSDDPFLYDLKITLHDGGTAVDSITSYFGMRSVGVVTEGGARRIALNGKPVFQLGPLDQGWWPDGLYTAPTDEALRFDVEITKQLGFNMTRKHIKVEPQRWYYHADRLGLPVWQDMPSGWNDSPEARRHFESELREMLEERHNHPSIVAWVPFNEKWGQFDTKRISAIVETTDSSRLVNDASGWQHEEAGHMIDVHRYQGPQAMRGEKGRIAVVGEYGGLGFKVDGHAWAGDAWGYGGLFPTREALADRYDLLAKRLYRDKDTHGMGAGVYTQLTDVEVELNGFLTYDREVLKFDTARTAAVNRGHAPYILPELGEFTESVRVEIHQGHPTEVRFTTDGSEPTAQSPRYTAPFTVRQTTTVRAKSFLNGAPTAAPEARVEYVKGPGRAPVAVASSALAPGLHYEYYADTTPEPHFRMNWPVRWQVERPETRQGDIPAKKSGTQANISIAPRDTTEMFSFRWKGYVRVPRTGVYTFTALSDDGAAMWIGDRNIFWSVGQSPKTTESWGSIALQRGLHPVTITYFQAYGPMAMELYVEGPGMRRQRVPASMLVRDRTPAAAGTTTSGGSR